MNVRIGSTILVAAGTLGLSACDDDTTMPIAMETFEVTIENVSPAYDFAASGAFDTPVGEATPGPLFPGGSYEFEISAAPGSYLTFATMMVQSNDWFYAPDGDGIALWDGAGMQVSGDVTDQVLLWDAGTEEDQEPGTGTDQAPRQAGPDTGDPDDDDSVRLAADDFGNMPDVADVIAVTITPNGETSFVITIENASDATTLSTSTGSVAVPLSPGVWVVHADENPLFTVGEADRDEGVEAIAEDGDASALSMDAAGRSGFTGLLSPGAWAVHAVSPVLFSEGDADFGDGLEGIAEDGNPTDLAASLTGDPDAAESGVFNTPLGAAGPRPAFPGESFTFQVTAESGDRLSFATMFAQSNDLFYAPSEDGIDLFPGGTALSGDVTGMIQLWDAGTEVNQEPGLGLDQAPRQSGPNVGTDEGGVVGDVMDAFSYPATADFIRVTVTPVG